MQQPMAGTGEGERRKPAQGYTWRPRILMQHHHHTTPLPLTEATAIVRGRRATPLQPSAKLQRNKTFSHRRFNPLLASRVFWERNITHINTRHEESWESQARRGQLEKRLCKKT
ncbi:hypothetical protein E2C01_059112 [Portunus trituberculatus]|uniref:Uncharacterized protein n=1 Tax=Portunus trituberculatus TaxID=210409 RepID=A0A5B7H7G6_PORTR|nr:hypothetical protein [Portunus trituberculatus]